ncbi:MAG: hypothetical protein KAY37_04990 [Phycisphaerae bacterium]|nr:hypothetical protein [Phycisphaerae bacterium]
MGLSDFPPAYMPDVRPLAFSGRPANPSAAGADGISRFSCMERLRMRGFFDSAGPACVFPCQRFTRGVTVAGA